MARWQKVYLTAPEAGAGGESQMVGKVKSKKIYINK